MTDPDRRPLSIHVVTHTHWDREWYRTAEEFRLALVQLVDEVLDGVAGPHFLLDGQAIVLLDYLAVRPERAADLRRALQEGRVEAGPWFVLGDNLIPAGESLVRNLLVGRAMLGRLGASPPDVLYCPDAFGHPAALPQLAAGFGIPLCVVWRGYGGAPWPDGDSARWMAADGSAVLLHHLAPDGYELGANLSPSTDRAREVWERLLGILGPRATLGVALLPNGADHHAVQSRRAEALAALAEAAAPVALHVGGLRHLVEALVRRAADRSLPTVAGELRHSPNYVWSLQGTFGTRAHQKRENAHAERLLVYDAEPQLALASWQDGGDRRHVARALWLTLLACHPHDTLCGCSSDAVAAAMDRRLDEVRRTASLAARRARLTRLGHDPVVARDRTERWRPVIAAWNAVARPRCGMCELEIDEPLEVVPVGPGSASTPVGRTLPRARTLQLDGGAIPLQELSRELVHVRDESPRHYPRNVLMRRRRVLAWVPEVAALGLRTLAAGTGRARTTTIEQPVACGGDWIDNTLCRVAVTTDRALAITFADGSSHPDVVGLEVCGERGDLYTHSPIPGTWERGTIVRHRRLLAGPMRGALRLTMRAVVPARTLTSATGKPVRRRRRAVVVTVDVSLDAGSRVVTFLARDLRGAPDARVRLTMASGLAHPAVWADAAFGEVLRSMADRGPPLALGTAGEAPSSTAPLHRYVSLYSAERGVTLFSDGLAEYEVMADGRIAVTLLRAVGELSRRDLPERPGHAGWPVATPGAQDAPAPGRVVGRFALLTHSPRGDEVRTAVQRAAEDFLVPLSGDTWLSAVTPPPSVAGPVLHGAGLAFSACKQGEDGRSLVVRCVNRLDRPVEGAWQLTGVREAWLARLDETPLGALVVRNGAVTFQAPPRATVTVLLRA